MALSEDITQRLNITYIYKQINWCQKITKNKQFNRSTIVAVLPRRKEGNLKIFKYIFAFNVVQAKR